MDYVQEQKGHPGIRLSVMIVSRNYNDTPNKPPLHFCSILVCIKGGGKAFLIAGFYGIILYRYKQAGLLCSPPASLDSFILDT